MTNEAEIMQLIGEVEIRLAKIKGLMAQAQENTLTRVDLIKGNLYQHQQTKRFFWYNGRETVREHGASHSQESLCFLDGEQRPVKFLLTDPEGDIFIAALKTV